MAQIRSFISCHLISRIVYIFSIVTFSLSGFFSISKMIFNLLIVLIYVLVFFMPFPLPHFITRKKEAGPFGTPRKWATNRLPTRSEVGAYYHFKRMEMETSNGPIPSKKDVAAKVSIRSRDFEMNHHVRLCNHFENKSLRWRKSFTSFGFDKQISKLFQWML